MPSDVATSFLCNLNFRKWRQWEFKRLALITLIGDKRHFGEICNEATGIYLKIGQIKISSFHPQRGKLVCFFRFRPAEVSNFAFNILGNTGSLVRKRLDS